MVMGTTRTANSTQPGTSRPRLLDISQVAERLGVSVRHVRRLVFEHRIPYVKWGHLLRFDPTHIDDWIDAHRTPPA